MAGTTRIHSLEGLLDECDIKFQSWARNSNLYTKQFGKCIFYFYAVYFLADTRKDMAFVLAKGYTVR